MSAKVYYLSYFHENSSLLFPNELPENYYSPGEFFIEELSNSTIYSFAVMDNGSEKLLELTYVKNSINLYSIDTSNYGKIFFKKMKYKNNNIKYKGKYELAKELRVLVPLDVNKLERLCLKFNFYLIGSTKADLKLKH